MSQLSDLNSLDMINPPEQADYMAIAQLIEDTLAKLGKNNIDRNAYPDYYDDAWKQVIDLVPLE